MSDHSDVTDDPDTDLAAEPTSAADASDLVGETEIALSESGEPSEDGEQIEAVSDLGKVRLDAGGLVAAPRPRFETVRSGFAIVAAVGIHLAAIVLTGGYPATAKLGAGGDDDASLTVELSSRAEASGARTSSSDGRSPSGLRGRTAPTPGQETQRLDSAAQADSQREAGAVVPAPVPPTPKGAVPKPDDRANETVIRVPPASEPPAERAPISPKSSTVTQRDADEPPVPQPPRQPTSAASAESAPSEETVASRIGGTTGVDPDSEPDAVASARLAAGRLAKDYGANVLKSLPKLEAHLNRTSGERKLAVRGRVLLLLTIGLDGRPERIVVQRSSGLPALDAAARRALLSFRFPPAPATLTERQRTYSLPITYR
ncbi:MAG: TonB family protein [Pseudomonadota bacterium]